MIVYKLTTNRNYSKKRSPDGRKLQRRAKMPCTPPVPIPIPIDHRIKLAVLIAKEVYWNKAWQKWVKNWLSGKDTRIRTAEKALRDFRRRHCTVQCSLPQRAALHAMYAVLMGPVARKVKSSCYVDSVRSVLADCDMVMTILCDIVDNGTTVDLLPLIKQSMEV